MKTAICYMCYVLRQLKFAWTTINEDTKNCIRKFEDLNVNLLGKGLLWMGRVKPVTTAKLREILRQLQTHYWRVETVKRHTERWQKIETARESHKGLVRTIFEIWRTAIGIPKPKSKNNRMTSRKQKVAAGLPQKNSGKAREKWKVTWCKGNVPQKKRKAGRRWQ